MRSRSVACGPAPSCSVCVASTPSGCSRSTRRRTRPPGSHPVRCRPAARRARCRVRRDDLPVRPWPAAGAGPRRAAGHAPVAELGERDHRPRARRSGARRAGAAVRRDPRRPDPGGGPRRARRGRHGPRRCSRPTDGSAPPSADQSAVAPDTVWVVGPRAAERAQASAASVHGHVVARTQWLADRRSDPLAGGLLALLALVALVCSGFATIVVVLGAASSAPGRARSLATARVLGLRGWDTVRVAAGELLPPTLVAALGGVLIGALLVGALVAPLALRLVTGQVSEPTMVVSWWSVVPSRSSWSPSSWSSRSSRPRAGGSGWVRCCACAERVTSADLSHAVGRAPGRVGRQGDGIEARGEREAEAVSEEQGRSALPHLGCAPGVVDGRQRGGGRRVRGGGGAGGGCCAIGLRSPRAGS